MKLLWDILLLALAVAIFIPSATLLLECSLALFPRFSSSNPKEKISTELAILIPAHNEAMVIRSTLESLLPQVKSAKNIVVIADNCTDNTAEIASQYDVTVIKRDNEQQRGKGYALDFGLRFLQSHPPEIVIFVDADCIVEPGAIERLAREAVITGKPIQALYLLKQPHQPTKKHLISAFSFLVKNLVRPIGLAQIGLPCLLTGTGMAFPWSVLQKVSLASSNIVEDMQLGLDLALAGYSPRFCPEAKVTGVFPQQEKAAKTQRKRWEHGHLKTILNQLPTLLWSAFTQRRWDLLTLGLELSVPPLSLLVMLWGISLIGTLLSWILGFSSGSPAILLMIAGLFLLIAIMSAWTKFGRHEIPITALIMIPFYFLGKIPLYLAFLLRPQSLWVRTERDHPSSSLN